MDYRTKWLQQPNVATSWAIAAIIIWVALVSVVEESQIAEDLDNKVSLPLFFRVRDTLNLSPQIHPKIKVYAIDDSTVSWLGKHAMSTDQWVDLISSIDKRQPKTIIIDAMFSIAEFGPDFSPAAQEEQLKRLGNVKTPVVVGAFAAPKEISYRKRIALEEPEYDLTSYVKKPSDASTDRDKIAAALNLYESRSEYIYGPDPRIRSYFDRIGQILYFGNSRFIPFLRVKNYEGVAVPHIMVFADQEPRFYKGQLFLNGTKVPTYVDGTAPINFNSFGYYLKHTKPLHWLLDKKIAATRINDISSGDYVYIIPSFYTGNTDFKLTPFGHMPAGYAHLAVLNSILSKDWLIPVNYQFIFIIGGAVMGALLALRLGPIGVAVALILGNLFWVVGCMYLFAFHNVLLSLIFPLVSYMGTLVSIFVEKSRISEKKSQFIRHALDGAIRPKDLEAIARQPSRLNFEARERVVTVMFIDVVGFSLLAENQLPRIAFDSLKAVLSDITKIVHDYGGIVNKNLGDGLLCFFGYSLETDQSTFDHAEKALECAIKIQKENVPKMLAAYEKNEPVYPLRIGINTSSVYLGNLGTSNRLDFTVVGNGVNFAKRLEGGCLTHSVMMGATTHELVEPLGIYQDGLQKRLIEIKHHNEMVEAWEYDPFYDQIEVRAAADHAHKSCRHHARIERRWNVDLPDNIMVTTSKGQGTMVNFSNTGLSLRLPSHLIKGSVLNLNLDSKDGSLKNRLSERGLDSVSVEVRWGYEDGKTYLHGVRFRNLSTAQTIYLVDQLCEYGLANQAWKRDKKLNRVS